MAEKKVYEGRAYLWKMSGVLELLDANRRPVLYGSRIARDFGVNAYDDNGPWLRVTIEVMDGEEEHAGQ